MGKVFKSNTWLLILDPEVFLWIWSPVILINESNLTIKVEYYQVKYQESSTGFENLAYLQSIEKKCKNVIWTLIFMIYLAKDHG